MDLLLLLIWLPAALAARLDASLPVDELSVGQTVELQVQLSDGKARGLPSVDHGAGLQVAFLGQGQSVVSVNFKTTRIVRYTYSVTAIEPGIHTLGPILLEAEGQSLRVDPSPITVTERSAAEQATHTVSATLSEDAPYVGQTAVYKLRWRRTEDVQNRSWTLPDFPGFVQDRTVEPEGREHRIADKGVAAQVEEIWVPLVASAEGAHSIGPALLELAIPEERTQRNRRYDPFFDRTPLRTERLATDRIAVTTRPLPTAGKPADFSGLVGQFSLTATPSARSVPLGGSITLEVKLEGDGALTGFTLPPLPAEAGLRAYDDAPEISATLKEGRYQATALYRRALVPDREGTVSVPPIEVHVFEPSRGAYVLLRTEPLTLTVTPGEQGGEVASFADAPLDRRRDVEALGDDILPPPSSARIQDATLRARLPLALGLPLLPLLAWLGLGLDSRRRARAPTLGRAAAPHGRPARRPRRPPRRLGAALSRRRWPRLGVAGPAVDRAGATRLGPDAATLYADLEATRYGGQPAADLEARVRAFVESRP